jgi:hypothetical protein
MTAAPFEEKLHEPASEPPTWRPLRAAEMAGDLDDVLRPIGPDGSYDLSPAPEPLPPPAPATPRSTSAEELAQAARRAERLAAEARAAYERHATTPTAGVPADGLDAAWPPLRYRDPAGPRPGGPREEGS